MTTVYPTVYTNSINVQRGDDMQTTIQKWGNSHGIRIPKAFLEAVGMSENDRVEIERVEDSIVIKKAVVQNDVNHQVTLREIFAEYGSQQKTEPYNWGTSVGKEVW